jgi:murein endopeptidase/LysM repeat protein
MLALAVGALGWAPEAGARGGHGSKSKKKAGKKKGKQAKAPARIRPVSRDADAPLGVTDGGELDDGGEDDLTGGEDPVEDPQDELEAIERELLAQPPPVEPAPVTLPPPVVDTKPIDLTPRQVRHEVIPGETVDDVARRYAVEVRKLLLWNGLKAEKGKNPPLRAGKRLRIREAVNPPPPRERVEHTTVKGDTWAALAKSYGVPEAQLRAWNRKLKGDDLPAKKTLVLWREPPPEPAVAGGGLAAKLAAIRVRPGGISIGRPSRGRLVRGVELPDRPDLYTRRKPDEAYGSTHAITQLMVAITRFRHETGFKRQVQIGGISRPRGGRFRPHKSHQSGRDIDIRMPLLAAAEGKKHTTSADVDWKATWQLMHAFIAGGEVEYIFLEHRLQKKLYKAAREAGATKEQLSQWLQWPARPKSNHGIVRHVEGHTVHFHVRIRCAPGEKHCVTVR